MQICICQIDQGCNLTSQIRVWKLPMYSAANYCTNKFIPVTSYLPVAQGRDTISHSMISKEQLWT